MHAFWMLYKSTPFPAENGPSALVAALPLVVIAIVGLAMRLRAARVAIVGIESLLHLSAAACMAILLLYVTLHDPLDPVLPLTWPLCFWGISMAFALLANLALHERMRGCQADAAARTRWVLAVATGLALWVALVWIAAGMAWAPYFLTVSVVFHSIMARMARQACSADAIRIVTRRGRLESTVAFAEVLFAVALMLTALLRFLFTCNMSGTAELKYFQFVDIATVPWFTAGAMLAVLASRFRFAFLAHALIVAVFLLSGESSTWPISLAMGYGLPVVFLASSRQGAFAYALSVAATAGMWLLGMLCFMLAGVIILYDVGLDFAKDLVSYMRVVTPVLYVAWLASAGLSLRRSKGESPPVARSEASTPYWARGLTFAAICVVILAPVFCLFKMTMSPPVWFDRAERVEVGEPTGFCHAGYSRSDEEYATLDELGAKLLRVDFRWDSIQSDPETWNFANLDAYLDAANAHKANVLAVLAFDNDNVERSPSGSKRSCYIAPEDIPLFLEYIRRTVGRYKNRVYAWEIWNEPDMPRFWTGTAEEFYELARRTAETVRQVHPEARILGAAMTSGVGAILAREVEGLHTSGALKEVDHPTMHTYLSDPRGYYNEFLRVQNAAAKNGHPGSVWITELGDPDGGVYPWRASSDLLAEHVVKAYTIATSLGIEKLVWYCYLSRKVESLRQKPNDSEGFFGLVEGSGQWKPAAHAYRLFSKNCSNSVIRTDLVEVSGGIAARQLRTALYRRDDGQSVLIMWFEPGLRPGAHARVTIELGTLEEPAVMHDISSTYTKHLLDKVVDVTERPLFITYKAPARDTPARLCADSSPADGMWLMSVVGLVLWACCASLRAKRTDCVPAC